MEGPTNQLTMIKLMINLSLLAQGLYQSQLISNIFDGVARHTRKVTSFSAAPPKQVSNKP
jgi:enoyl-CoA hydratase